MRIYYLLFIMTILGGGHASERLNDIKEEKKDRLSSNDIQIAITPYNPIQSSLKKDDVINSMPNDDNSSEEDEKKKPDIVVPSNLSTNINIINLIFITIISLIK
jgi:hypothetical protein